MNVLREHRGHVGSALIGVTAVMSATLGGLLATKQVHATNGYALAMLAVGRGLPWGGSSRVPWSHPKLAQPSGVREAPRVA